MKKLLPLFVFLLPFLNYAQALSGTYVIGKSTTTDFKTLTAAVTRINEVGVAGPVTFLLNDTTYNKDSGEVFPIRITQFKGSSATNTLTIKPNVNKEIVTITSKGIDDYTPNTAAIQLDGADNIIIDGSNTANGTSRNLTVESAEDRAYISRTVIWLSSKSGNSVDNIRIANTKLKMLHRNGAYALMSGILSAGGTVDLTSTSGAINKKLVVTNNEFINLRSGITVRGASNALKSQELAISLNTFGTQTTGQRIASPIEISFANNFSVIDNVVDGFGHVEGGEFLAGIRINESSNFSVKKNIIEGLKINDNSKASYGLLISGATQNAVISENKITDLENLTTQNIIQAVGIATTPSSTGISLINNFISKIFGGGPSTNTGHGIYVTEGGQGMKIYHNTVAMNVQQPGWSTAITIAAGTGFDVRNNSFTNNTALSPEYSESSVIRSYSASAFTQLNNNNYFGARIGRIGTNDYATLANWQTITGKDGNSKNRNPTFVSLIDLHLQSVEANADLNNTGANLFTAVPIDIDGQARTTQPDIGADEFSIAATLATQPIAQSTALNFTNVTANSFNISWTKGTGTGTNSIVVIRSGSAVNSAPVDATAYSANTIFGSGSQIGSGNYVVYNGNSNTVTVTGLSAATTYHVSVYEYNGSGATANYLATAPLSSSQLTINAALGWQIADTNTLTTISFDTTVSGVNNGPFKAAGFAPAPVAGQLNSNAWAVAGFEDGQIPFGGTNSNPDFGRGVSNGGVSVGGIYAFKTSGDNAALGIQPTSDDFTPGSITLRFQNQTSAPITSLSVGYKVFVYNDQAASNSFNFSHSADNANFTGIPELAVISPATADVVPSWKASYRVATITGINIPANGFYYLKWTGDEVVIGSAYDEFALDDIVLSANPTSNYVTFEGVAENLSVHGNASLSGELKVNGDLKFTAGKLSVGANTLTIGGNVINTIAGGIKGGATSNITVINNGNKTLSFDQTTSGVSNLFNDFSVPYSAAVNKTVFLDNPVTISGSLSVGLDQTLDLGTNQLTGDLSTITINGTVLTQNTQTPFPAGKTWGGTGILHLNAASEPQKLVAGTYTNLTLSSPKGTLADASVTVNGILDLPSPNPTATTGSLDTAGNIVTMGFNASNTGKGDVTGITKRESIVPGKLYTFGHPNTSISFSNAGTLPSSMSLKTTIGATPSWRPGAIQRTFDLTQSGAIGTKAIIRGHYLDTELNGNDETKLVDFAHIYASEQTPAQTLEQGRSNYNPTENWVELTNVNIGLYFTNNFGAVNLTFDESQALTLTWNGSKDTSWTTAANWTPSTGTTQTSPSAETKVIIPNVANLPNQPTLNDTSEVQSIIIETGGELNSPADAILKVYGSAGAWQNNGAFNASTGKVIFKTLDATISGRTTFNKLEIDSNASLRALEGNYMKIKDSLVNKGLMSVGLLPNTIEFVGTNQTIPLPGGQDRNGYHHVTITGTGAIFPANLNVRGNIMLHQSVEFGGKTINLTGDTNQKIGGTVNPVFNNLTINNTGPGVTLNTAATVNGVLKLTAGLLNVSSFDLTLGQNEVAGNGSSQPFGTTNMIVAEGSGFVRRPFTAIGSYLFPIGELTSNPAYSPITVHVKEGSFSNAFVEVSVKDMKHPANQSSQNYLSRYWSVKQTGITGAVATVTAAYIASEVLFPEEPMSAAQLTGTFSQRTNPWKRVGKLNNEMLTLNAETILQPDEISYFTGIKGGEFTSTISGGGAYCGNQPVTLTSTVTGGDMPYTYEWSGELGDKATATPTSSGKYTVTVRDANGILASAQSVVNISPAVIAGTLIAGNPVACLSSTPDPITLSDNSESVLYWERSEYEDFTNATRINSTDPILSGANAGIILGKTYFRAVVGNALCGQVYSNAVTVETKTSVWKNNAWSDGVPDIRTAAVILDAHPIDVNFNACSLTVADNAIVTVDPNVDVTLAGALTIGSGSFTMESNTNLIQTSDAQNYGSITVKRESAPLYRLDYTMWGSPVTGTQTLKDFSPSTLVDRFYTYDSATDLFKSIPPAANSFIPGKGYLIRMPNNHVIYGQGVQAKSWTGSFTGTPTNGPVSISLDLEGEGYNMVANPYASMIDANKFLAENSNEISGTLYFWRRRNAEPPGLLGTRAYYATYTSAGGVGVGSGVGITDIIYPFSTDPPNGFIQVGQGFLVKKALLAPQTGNLQFTNAMRTAENPDNQFFRNAEERSRIWLNVTNAAGEFGQTLIAYMPSADNGIDRTDGKYLGDGSTALTSWLDNTEYIIQGRAPFTSSDVVPLNFRTLTAGSYTIAIDNVDGIFSGNQNIFLRDRLTGVLHNLKASAYNFATEAGSFNSRFEVVYENGVLSVDSPAFDSNSVVLYKKENNVFVSSQKVILDHVEAYDLNGRLLAVVKNINSKEVSVNVGTTNQVLIFKITSVEGVTVSKKIIN